jgi:hypothetical protein
MDELKTLWKKTEEFVEQHEKQIAEKYTRFLREVARRYLSKGKRVFFKENRVVHYAEGGFGWLIVECDDDEYEVFGAHVPEIMFEQKVNERDIKGFVEIKEENLENIKYEL